MLDAIPFLTFQPSRGQSASEAMQFYVHLFEDARSCSSSAEALTMTAKELYSSLSLS